MKRFQSTTIRSSILLGALACLAGCATPATEAAGDEQTVVASNTEPAEPVVIENAAVVGQADSGDRVYCRRRAPTGSRVAKTTCMTEEQRKQQQEFGKDILKNADLRPLKR